MDNRIFEFDNRFPDSENLAAVIAYLRELSATLNSTLKAMEKELTSRADAIEATCLSLSSRVGTVETRTAPGAGEDDNISDRISDAVSTAMANHISQYHSGGDD